VFVAARDVCAALAWIRLMRERRLADEGCLRVGRRSQFVEENESRELGELPRNARCGPSSK